jgi:hypothetical protein
MAKQESELATLRESVHSLGEALQLLRNIFQAEGATFNSNSHFRKFEAPVKDVLVKLLRLSKEVFPLIRARGSSVSCDKTRIAIRIALTPVARQQGSLYVSKRLNKSTGTGKIMVELFSDDISTRLCRNLRCKAIGCFSMTSAASASFCEA